MIELLICNLSGKTRKEILNESEYLVAPLTMIVPGVLNGSQGPLYYPLEELQKQPADWNHIPIVLYHPVRNGSPISAKDPEVLNTSQLGVLLNAKTDEKLVAEGWFHVENTKRIAPVVWKNLEQGKPVELSTGLSLDVEPVSGEFNGTAYKAIARNYRPDHLAILPDQTGACSIRDGCGVLVNEEHDSSIHKEISMAKKELVDRVIANCECWNEEDREVLNSLDDGKLEAIVKHIEDHAQKTAVANAAMQGFKHGDVGFTFNKETLKFDAKEEPKTAPKKEETPAPVANAKPQTADEWLAAAPPEIQSVVHNALAAERKQKEALVTVITANKSNVFKPEQLMAKTVDELEAIAALAKVAAAPVANYFGAAVPPTTVNKEDKEEPLLLPTIDWSKA